MATLTLVHTKFTRDSETQLRRRAAESRSSRDSNDWAQVNVSSRENRPTGIGVTKKRYWIFGQKRDTPSLDQASAAVRYGESGTQAQFLQRFVRLSNLPFGQWTGP